MLPARFELHRPESLAEALRMLGTLEDVTPYAGGTELLVAMKARVLRYAHVVDIKRVPELRGVHVREGKLFIGALCSHHQLANHPLVKQHFPAYAELSDKVANIRVRAAGTIGGNLCFAEPHADPPAMLCALEATVLLAGPEGQRQVPMADFILGEFTTAREEQELMLGLELPLPQAGQRAAYRAFGHLERPAAGVAAVLTRDQGVPAWRFWAGAICSPAVRLQELEQRCHGIAPDRVGKLIEQHAPAIAGSLPAQDDLHGSAEYKRHLIGVLAQRAAEACIA